MSNTTDYHVLRMSCQTVNTIDSVWGITVPCLLAVGILINAVMCVDMVCRKEYSTGLANFFVFHLSLVDLTFRVVTIVPWILLMKTDSTEESRNPCKALQTIDAMCGAAFFTTLVLIFWYYYRRSSLRKEEQFSGRDACGIVVVVWLYAIVSSFPFIISASSARYTEIPEVALNITEELTNCDVPKLCDLQRDWRGKFSSTWYFCLGLLIPMLAIIVLYAMTATNPDRETLTRISTSTSQLINQETPQNDSIYEANKKVFRLLIALSVFVALFWGPTSVIFMLRSYDLLDRISSGVVLHLLVIFEIFKFFNSLPNPFIFWCFIPSFRNKWRRALNCCKPNAQSVPINNNYGSGSTTVLGAFSESDV